mgnify:FL=1
MVVEGAVGSGPYSDIAIDDVSFSESCNKQNSGRVTVTGVQTTASTVSPCGASKFQ